MLGALHVAPGMSPHASAQEPPTGSWRLVLWAHTGYQYPGGRFASNSPSGTGTGPLGILDAFAEFGGSQMHGGGVELAPPATDISFRAGWETTVGAKATGSLGICALVGGAVCQEEVAPLAMRGVVLEARTSRADSQRRLASVIGLGIGLRWFGFSVPDCTGKSDDALLICDAITDLYREPRSHFVLRLSVGLQAHLTGPLLAELGGSAGTGRYRGGARESNGLWYHDLRINVSVGVALH